METFASDSSSKMAPTPHIACEPKPPAYKAVRVFLSDGSRILGMWTGVKWWSTKGEIKPVRWELEERRKKTERRCKATTRREDPPKGGTFTRAFGRAHKGPFRG
jgi:hypothetical protein